MMYESTILQIVKKTLSVDINTLKTIGQVPLDIGAGTTVWFVRHYPIYVQSLTFGFVKMIN
jgi:hypothetical protein